VAEDGCGERHHAGAVVAPSRRAGHPDPDVIIHQGEQRLSNFLLWQSAIANWCSFQSIGRISTAQPSKRHSEYRRRERASAD